MGELFSTGLWQNLLAALLWAAAVAMPKLVKRFGPKNLRWLQILYAGVFALVIISNALVVNSGIRFRIAGLAFTALFLLIVYKELHNFWQLGLVRADLQVKDGIDYAKSLALTKNQLWFLGLGASKLTSVPGFENAIKRCNGRGTSMVRFLLMDPDGDTGILATAEQRAQTRQGRYRELVRESLGTIGKLQKQKFDIEVRLYRGTDFNPILRLMFIDDTLCLVSHYVFGEGDGSQLPQLCFLNPRHSDERTANSFYGAFRHMFDSYWREGTPWSQEQEDR